MFITKVVLWKRRIGAANTLLAGSPGATQNLTDRETG
jgi:hypothetical protein